MTVENHKLRRKWRKRSIICGFFAVRTRTFSLLVALQQQDSVRNLLYVACRSDWMEESSRRADSEESSSSDGEGPRRVADMDVDSEPAAEETPADSITQDEREVSLTNYCMNFISVSGQNP